MPRCIIHATSATPAAPAEINGPGEQRRRSPESEGEEAAAEKHGTRPSHLRPETAERLEPDRGPKRRADQPSPFPSRRRTGEEEEAREWSADEHRRRNKQVSHQRQQRSPRR